MSDFSVLKNVLIEMKDGIKLSANIFLPKGVENSPAPAILEYIPYRKGDIKAARDYQIHGYFAKHGYAGIRVDIRGSGNSEGILQDEYLEQELEDGLTILQWLAAQPWCSGDVGMFGLSWGGFNGLQIAALNPPELKAVITVCSSDDRYVDDVHYMGGCLLTDNLSWASTMFAFNSYPPDPMVVGDDWREMWLKRLEKSGLWLKNWLNHQRRDDYWKHASVCEDYSAIKVPVFAVSGWADGYSNTVFRLLQNLRVPRKGLVGSWGHKYPHMGGPGPTIDFLGESVRWWDHWLKNKDTGMMEEPMLQAWMQDTVSPLDAKRPGWWVAEKNWPSQHIQNKIITLKPGLIDIEAKKHRNHKLKIQSPLSVGLFAGKWCSYSEATDLPSDQREDDGGALVFDTLPLEAPIEIFGAPEVELEVSSNKPRAQIAVRLSDIAPNDRATRVTYGVFNLTHLENHSNPKDLKINKRYRVKIPMNHIAQHFPAGNRIRLSFSTSYWPLVWPAPEQVKLEIHTGTSRLILPVREPQDPGSRPINLGKPPLQQENYLKTTLLIPSKREWNVVHNLATNEVSLNVTNNDQRTRIEDIQMECQREVSEKYSFINNNYETVRGEVITKGNFKRRDWDIQAVTQTLLTSTPTHFRIRATCDAYENETRIFSKSWDELIARDFI